MKKSISELNYSELLNYANNNYLSDSEKDEVVDSLINFRKYSEYNVYFLTITWLNTNQREKLINSLLENCSEKVIYNFSVSLGNKLYESEVNYIFDKIYEFNDEDYVFMYIKEFFNVLKDNIDSIINKICKDSNYSLLFRVAKEYHESLESKIDYIASVISKSQSGYYMNQMLTYNISDSSKSLLLEEICKLDDDFILNNDGFILNSIDKIANVSNPSFIKKIFEIILHRYPERIFQVIGMGKYTDIIDSIIDEKIIRSIISNKDMFNMLFLHANDGSVEKIFHSRAFRNVIDNDKELTFGIMYFINLYDVHNEYIDHLNKNFAMIQNVRPELSWFNSSLKKELLEDEVINVLGVDYLNIVLNFDTIATDAVIRAYNNHNLYELKEYTDFIVSITKNIRDINKSIGFFIKL